MSHKSQQGIYLFYLFLISIPGPVLGKHMLQKPMPETALATCCRRGPTYEKLLAKCLKQNKASNKKQNKKNKNKANTAKRSRSRSRSGLEFGLSALGFGSVRIRIRKPADDQRRPTKRETETLCWCYHIRCFQCGPCLQCVLSRFGANSGTAAEPLYILYISSTPLQQRPAKYVRRVVVHWWCKSNKNAKTQQHNSANHSAPLWSSRKVQETHKKRIHKGKKKKNT